MAKAGWRSPWCTATCSSPLAGADLPHVDERCGETCGERRSRPGLVGPDLLLFGGAAGNRTRVQRHSLEASPCAVRYVSTRISRSREQVRMTIPVAVWCPDESRDRTHRLIPLADARVRAEGAPGLTDSPSLMQRGRSRADLNRRLIGCNDAYGGLLPAQIGRAHV